MSDQPGIPAAHSQLEGRKRYISVAEMVKDLNYLTGSGTAPALALAHELDEWLYNKLKAKDCEIPYTIVTITRGSLSIAIDEICVYDSECDNYERDFSFDACAARYEKAVSDLAQILK